MSSCLLKVIVFTIGWMASKSLGQITSYNGLGKITLDEFYKKRATLVEGADSFLKCSAACSERSYFECNAFELRTCSECYLYTIFEEPGNLKSDDNNGELLYFRENETGMTFNPKMIWVGGKGEPEPDETKEVTEYQCPDGTTLEQIILKRGEKLTNMPDEIASYNYGCCEDITCGCYGEENKDDINSCEKVVCSIAEIKLPLKNAPIRNCNGAKVKGSVPEVNDKPQIYTDEVVCDKTGSPLVPITDLRPSTCSQVCLSPPPLTPQMDHNYIEDKTYTPGNQINVKCLEPEVNKVFNKKKLQFDTSGAKEFKFTCGADGEWAGDLTCKKNETMFSIRGYNGDFCRALPTIPFALMETNLVVVDGHRLFNIGGRDFNKHSQAMVYELDLSQDPETWSWKILDRMPLPIHKSKFVVEGNKLYSFGGYNQVSKGQNYIFTVDEYNIDENKWTEKVASFPSATGAWVYGVHRWKDSLVVIVTEASIHVFDLKAMRAVENIKVPHDFHIFKRRGRGWSAKVTLKNGKEGILLRKPKNDASLLFIDFDEIAKGPQVLETWMVPDSFKMYDDSVKKTSMKVELTQSSSYTNNEQKFGAKFGMDGKIVGSLANGAGGVTHTNKNQRYPWFQARFFHPVVVSKVVFYNRVKSNGDRFRNVGVHVGYDEAEPEKLISNPLCAIFEGPSKSGSVEEIVCDKPVSGTHLQIQLRTPGTEELLSINELEVYVADRVEDYVRVTNDGQNLIAMNKKQGLEYFNYDTQSLQAVEDSDVFEKEVIDFATFDFLQTIPCKDP